MAAAEVRNNTILPICMENLEIVRMLKIGQKQEERFNVCVNVYDTIDNLRKHIWESKLLEGRLYLNDRDLSSSGKKSLLELGITSRSRLVLKSDASESPSSLKVPVTVILLPQNRKFSIKIQGCDSDVSLTEEQIGHKIQDETGINIREQKIRLDGKPISKHHLNVTSLKLGNLTVKRVLVPDQLYTMTLKDITPPQAKTIREKLTSHSGRNCIDIVWGDPHLRCKPNERGLTKLTEFCGMTKVWCSTLRKLGLSEKDISNIKEDFEGSTEQAYQGLYLWTRQQSYAATWYRLCRLFQECNQNALRDKAYQLAIDESFAYSTSSSVKLVQKENSGRLISEQVEQIQHQQRQQQQNLVADNNTWPYPMRGGVVSAHQAADPRTVMECCHLPQIKSAGEPTYSLTTASSCTAGVRLPKILVNPVLPLEETQVEEACPETLKKAHQKLPIINGSVPIPTKTDEQLELTMKDYPKIFDYLCHISCKKEADKRMKIKRLGIQLGLHPNKVHKLSSSTELTEDTDYFLHLIITSWLHDEDKVSSQGLPTWKRLVDALRSSSVGERCLAKSISRSEGLEPLPQPFQQLFNLKKHLTFGTHRQN